MLINSIKIKNFRQFKETEISFANEFEKNVTVVLGDNTSGKTTLLQAFNWCLYGVAEFDTKDFLINMDVSRKMMEGDKEDVEVEIELIHGGNTYIVKRIQSYLWAPKGVRPLPNTSLKVSYKNIDTGITEVLDDRKAQRRINEILPSDLSNYFFFDTERIGSISSKSDVTDAVKDLLGLKVLTNTLDHLGTPRKKSSLIGKLSNNMDTSGNKKAEEALNKAQESQSQLDSLVKRLDEVENEIETFKDKKMGIEQVLRAHQQTAELQDKKDKLESNLNLEERNLEDANELLIDNFNESGLKFFAKPLMAKALDVLRDADISDRGIRDMNANSIRDIIARGKCVCGAEIIEGNHGYTCLMSELEFLPPNSLGTIIRNFKEKISLFDKNSSYFLKQIRNTYESIDRYKDNIDDYHDELNDISSKIKGKEDVRRYEENLLEVKKESKRLEDKKEKFIEDKGKLNKTIDDYNKIYEKHLHASEKNNELATYIIYAQEIYNWIDQDLSKKSEEIKRKLENKVNNIFNKMYHGKRKIMIDEKYRVNLFTVYDEDDQVETDESRGLETVKNFAFIGGLVDLARERIETKLDDDTISLSSEPYPLVMDAPFSNADGKHVDTISSVLPSVAEQVIIFVMEKDWTHAEKELSKKLGKKYYLDKHSETYTTIEKGW